MQTLRVAVGQFSSGYDLEKNWLTIEKLVYQAQAQKAQLLVLPEACQISFGAKQLYEVAQHHTPIFLDRLRALLKDIGSLYWVGGIVVPSRDSGRVFNQLIAINPEGELITRYNKIHLYDAFNFKESDQVCFGTPDRLGIFNIGDFRIGLINCYDLRFPELARALVSQGVNVLSVSAAWIAGVNKEAHWEILNRARAIENTSYVIASGQTPKRSCGNSMIIDPMGNILAGAGHDVGLACADLTMARITEVRDLLPCLSNRRLR